MVSCTTLFAAAVAGGVSVKRFGDDGDGARGYRQIGGVVRHQRRGRSARTKDEVIGGIDADRRVTCCAGELHFAKKNPDAMLPESAASAVRLEHDGGRNAV